MTVYLCKDNFEHILCGVYDAWMSKKGHQNVRLEIEEYYEYQMFCQYVEVEVTAEKFQKVTEAITAKISSAVYEEIYKASLFHKSEKADDIYRYLIYGFYIGKGIIHMLQQPEIHKIFDMARAVGHEAHQYTGFVRFSKIREDALISVIEPKHDILTLIAPHFSDRLSGEDWLIYDQRRNKALVHSKNKPWFLMKMGADEWRQLQNRSDEKEYQMLWKIFFQSISIKERENRVCQRGHLPLRYRSCMEEFQHFQ